MTRLCELIIELRQLERSDPERELGQHGRRAKEIRQELVRILRPERRSESHEKAFAARALSA